MAPTQQDRDTFERDGVVCLRAAVDTSWVEPLLDLADRELAAPSRWVTDTGDRGGEPGRLFTTRYLWQSEPAVGRFVAESPVAGIVADLLGSNEVRFYFDHLLVKEPHTADPTPWHQDIPYWPFLGRKIGSAWLALTPATVAESSLEFVRGSHRFDTYYAPLPFDGEAGWTADAEGEKIPDIDAARDEYDIIGFDVEPGDLIVFSAWTIHGAPGNAGANRRVALSTRWLGDDAVWWPHAGSDPTITEADVSLNPGEPAHDDARLPLVFRR